MRALILLALIQMGVLAGMAFDRTRNWQADARSPCRSSPSTPGDLFRVEYLELGHAVGRVRARLLDGPAPAPNAPFCVTVEKAQEGTWVPIKLTPDKIAGGDRRAERA